MRNAQLKFICRDVYLRVERSDTPFTRGYNAGQVIRVPVAHGEGNYIADGETIARLEGEGRVLFRYAAPDGMIDPNWNHNGAINAIAGILNERGNVLGMMPHPETTWRRRWAAPTGAGCSRGWWIISQAAAWEVADRRPEQGHYGDTFERDGLLEVVTASILDTFSLSAAIRIGSISGNGPLAATSN